MKPHAFLDEDARDRVAQYVLGQLDESEARALRLHLASCACCRAEVDSLMRTSRDLCLLYREVPPPGELWDRVLARIGEQDPPPRAARGEARAQSSSNGASSAPSTSPDDLEPSSNRTRAAEHGAQIWKGWASERRETLASFTFVSGSDETWEPTAVDGIEARRLFVDAVEDRATFLVRMAPGTAYPGHVHAGPEECFVLAGDLSVGDRRMRAGDYQRAESGSTHGVQSTEGGCVLLLVSSLRDEIVE
jgi:anti-sigma factor ChrR (cupin superfamily)